MRPLHITTDYRVRAGRMVLLLALLALSGCAVTQNARDCRCGDDTDGLRDRLNDGYSLMYSTAKGLGRADWLTTFKAENADVASLVDDVAQANDEIRQRFDELGRDFPALAFDRNPLPAMEQAARAKARSEKIDRFMPLTGQSGVAFERSLLLTLRGILGHQRLLAAAIAEQEPDTALAGVMDDIRARYKQLDDRSTALLESRYFGDGTGSN